MRIIHNAPKLELTDREYHLLDDTYTLIAAIDGNLSDADWNSLNSNPKVSLLDVRNAIGTLIDWYFDGIRDEL